MPLPPRNIEAIRADLQSPSAEVRRKAMQVLSYWVQQDQSIGTAALPLFRHAWQHETDPWTIVTAAKGIEQTAGEAEGRAALLNLLERPEQDIVASAVLNLWRELSTERLLALFSRATHTGLRRSLINVLGRKGGEGNPADNPARIFEVLTAAIGDPELRPYAIVAFEHLGDQAAIPHIERCLSDTTEAWCEDRGPMMRVCDVASDAIAALRKSRNRPGVPPRAVIAAAPAGTPGQSASATRSAASGTNIAGFIAVPRAPAPESKGTLYAIAPLTGAVIMVPWLLMFVIGVIGSGGKIADTPQHARAMDLVTIIPPACGLGVGLFGIAKRRVRGLWRHVILGVGCLLCLLASFPFLNEAWDNTVSAPSRPSAPAAAPNPPAVRVPIPSGKPAPMEERQPVDLKVPVASQP